ncbi:unnamed protein product [Musa acuminata subsp. malaccensis]|uniref:(wild Malaysian banana) hypothetical protein n=1 Tax=Musa acuminata subsp. malaccensis TaxID=214687 RepID=A0A804IRU7_MUSAM|nr:unnamed protein product [Musa acuminata subsp. malaccensis]
MAGRLSGVASRIMGDNGVAARSAASAFRSRSGMVWDNGTPYPEPCIDRLAPTVGKRWRGCAELLRVARFAGRNTNCFLELFYGVAKTRSEQDLELRLGEQVLRVSRLERGGEEKIN